MAFSSNSYPGNGSQTDFTVSFPFLDRSHVQATVDGVAATFTWLSNTVIRISPAPPNGTVVAVTRDTPLASRQVDWTSGGNINEPDLDAADLQLYYAVQEVSDKAVDIADAVEAADLIETLFESFNDLYLGAKASAPTLDNDGQPLTQGTIYYNTTSKLLYVWNGTTWIAPAPIASDYVSATGGGTFSAAVTINGVVTVGRQNTSGTEGGEIRLENGAGSGHAWFLNVQGASNHLRIIPDTTHGAAADIIFATGPSAADRHAILADGRFRHSSGAAGVPTFDVPFAQQYAQFGDAGVIQHWPANGIGGFRIGNNIYHHGGTGDKWLKTGEGAQWVTMGPSVGYSSPITGFAFFTAGSGTAGAAMTTGDQSEGFRIQHATAARNVVTVIGGAVGAPPKIFVSGNDVDQGLRIAAKGTGAVSIEGQNGSLAAVFANLTTTAADRMVIGGGNGIGYLSATGASADVILGLYSKGAAPIDMMAGGVRQAQIKYTSAATAYLTLTGGSADATLGAEGSASDIALRLAPKGSEVVDFRYAPIGAVNTFMLDAALKVRVNGTIYHIPLASAAPTFTVGGGGIGEPTGD